MLRRKGVRAHESIPAAACDSNPSVCSGAGPILERLVVSVNRTRLPVGLRRCGPACDVAAAALPRRRSRRGRSTRCPASARRSARGSRSSGCAPFATCSSTRRSAMSARSPISSLFGEGEEVSIEGTVGRVSKRSPRRRMSIVEATVSDDSGQIRATWFNQPWVAEQLRPGMRLRLIGSLRRGTFAVRDARAGVRARRPRPRLSRERGRHAEEAARARACRAARATSRIRSPRR